MVFIMHCVFKHSAGAKDRKHSIIKKISLSVFILLAPSSAKSCIARKNFSMFVLIKHVPSLNTILIYLYFHYNCLFQRLLITLVLSKPWIGYFMSKSTIMSYTNYIFIYFFFFLYPSICVLHVSLLPFLLKLLFVWLKMLLKPHFWSWF